MSSQATRMQIMRQVALRADGFYGKAEELAGLAVDGGTKRAQISGLETLANSTLKSTDVFDYIKLRTGRHQQWRNKEWGKQLLTYLMRDLKSTRREICVALDLSAESPEAQRAYLLLIREFIHQFAAHYEYAAAIGTEGADG